MSSYAHFPTTAGSLTAIVHRYHAGDVGAETELFDRIYPLVREVARRTATAQRAAIADGSDFAISAWMSFHNWIRRAELNGDESFAYFWNLLVQMTRCKANEHGRWETAEKRGGGRVISASSFDSQSDETTWLDTIASEEFSADFLGILYHEQLESLEPQLQNIALAKLQGYTNKQVAEMEDISERSVERKLERIRRRWSES